MSDAPETAQEDVQEAPEQDVTPAQAEGTEQETADQAEGKSEKKADEPEWLQKRIDRAVRRQREAERDAAVWRQMAELERQKNVTQQPAQSRQPTAQEFEALPPAQQAALVAAEVARRALEQERVNAAEAQRMAEAQRQQSEVAQQAQKTMLAGAKKYEDFEEVALSESVPISHPMAQAIAESDHGADIAYFLGKNLKEAERISRLSPIGAAREIGRLEARFAATANVSKAPPPGRTVGTRGGATGGLRDDMPLSEWMKSFDKVMRNG